MFEVAKKIDDKSFYIRLNTLCNAADAVTNDVQYHQHCWLYAQRNARQTTLIVIPIAEKSMILLA